MATLAPTKTPTRARDERTTFIQLLRRFHFHAGILVGPFLLVTAITGFLYALAPAAEQVIHADQIHASSTAQTVALDRQVATAQEQHPALQVSGVIVGKPGDTTRVMFDDATLKSSSYRRAVFVDPGTGAVRGDTVLYGSGQSFPERAWLSELHRRLLLGDVGRIYSELAASWLAPITLVGLILWWRGRRNRSQTARGKTLSARGRTLRSHRRIGVVIALGLFFLSATGLTWSQYAGQNVTNLRNALDWKTPVVKTDLPGSPVAPAGGEHADHAGGGTTAAEPVVPVDGSALLRAASTAKQQLRAPYEITPMAAGKAWKVRETRHSWTMGPNAVAVDPASGSVTSRSDFADWPVAAKLTDWGIRLHMGFVFGLANQIGLAALALALGITIVHGYRMWWLRRPTRATGWQMGRAPKAGAFLRLARSRPVPVALGSLAVLAWCWLAPLFATSLAGFLIVDAALRSAKKETGEGSCCS